MRVVQLLGALSVVVGASALVSEVGAHGGPSITGDWSRADGALKINISPCGEQLCAVNTWTRDPGGSNAVGDRMVMNLRPSEPAKLTGEVFDEKRRMTYAVQVSVERDAMKTEGCVLGGLACRTMHWIRAR